MTLITAWEIASNYPDNILIDAGEQDGAYVGVMYLLRNGSIHSELLLTGPDFATADSAIAALRAVANECIRLVENELPQEEP